MYFLENALATPDIKQNLIADHKASRKEHEE